MTSNTYHFEDKVVIVTGGGTGIGRAVTRAFLDNGATVVAAGRRQEPLDETVAGYERGHTHITDVSNHEQVAELVRSVVDRFGHLDVVCPTPASSRAARSRTCPTTSGTSCSP